jgi:hypothetical protein
MLESRNSQIKRKKRKNLVMGSMGDADARRVWLTDL